MTEATCVSLCTILLCFQIATEPIAANAESPPTPEAVTDQDVSQQIERAIANLDSDIFLQREKAEKELWRFGERAKQSLIQVAESGSLEASGRARRILADIELGITPDTAEDDASYIRRFGSATQAERAEILATKLKGGDFELVPMMIDWIDDIEVKQRLFRQSLADTPIMVKLIEGKKLVWWAQKAREFNANLDRHELIVSWLANEKTLRDLRDEDKLGIIESMFAQEPHDASRFALASELLTEPTFGRFIAAQSHLDLLLRIIDLPTNPGASQDLLLTLIRESQPATLFQPDVFRKIMRFAGEHAPAMSTTEIQMAMLDLLASSAGASKFLSVEVYSELSKGLTDADFARVFDKAMTQYEFADWIYATDHFRPLLDWAMTLSVDSRNHWIQRVNADLVTRRGWAKRLLGEPSTFEIYWRMIDAIPTDEARHRAKFALAGVVALETHVSNEHRKELVRMVMETQTAEADVALVELVSNAHYLERVYDQPDSVQKHFQRCAVMGDVSMERLFPEFFNTLLSADALRRHFASATHGEWLLDVYIPSLPEPKRQLAVTAMCRSVRLVQTFQGKPLSDRLLVLAQQQSDPRDRLSCIATILHYERFSGLAKNDPKVQLLALYRDESFPEDARAEFASRVVDNPSFLPWLSDSGQAADWIAFVEQLAADRDKPLPPVYCSAAFVTLIAKQDRLDAWMARIDGDKDAERRAVWMITQNPDLMTSSFYDQHFEHLLRWTDSAPNSYERSSQLVSILLSPQAIELHKRRQGFGDLLERIAAEEDRIVQASLLRALNSPDAVKALAESGETESIVQMIKSLPSEKRASALSLVSSRALIDHIVRSDQVDWLFDLVTSGPSGVNLQSHPSLIELLIKRGYIDRLMENAATAKDREALLLQLLSSQGAVRVYAREGRLKELVTLFRRVEPGMTRDRALHLLFEDSETSLAVCRELGASEAISLASTIEYPHYLAHARANALIAACSLEKLSQPLLRQLLTDTENRSSLGASGRQRLVQGDVGEQLIAAGLLPQLKEVFLKSERATRERANEPLDEYYGSVLVLKHLRDAGNLEEFFEFARSIREPNELKSVVFSLIVSDQGCQALLSSDVFPKFASTIETMSEYHQSAFWGRFCVEAAVIRHVSHSEDTDRLWEYLMNRKQTREEVERLVVQLVQSERLDRVVRNRVLVGHIVKNLERFDARTHLSIASYFARHPGAILAMVESDQWDSLVTLLECEATPELRLSRWQSCGGPHGGLISALIRADRYDTAVEVLRKVDASPSEFTWNRLWLDIAMGRLDERLKEFESHPEKLDAERWRWIAWAYRARGEEAKAVEAAKKADDHSLVVALAIERGDWNEVATLVRQAAGRLSGGQPRDEEPARLEHHAMLLLAQRFANPQGDFQPSIDAIRNLRDSTDNLRVRSRCCDALMLGGQTEEALSFMDEHIMHRALRLRLHRGEYAAAIQAVKWNAEDPQSFLKAMHASSGNASIAIQSTVELLSALRGQERHHDMRVLHEAVMNLIMDPTNGSGFGQQLGHYANLLYYHQLNDLFWIAAMSMEPHAMMMNGYAMNQYDGSDRDYVVQLTRLLARSSGMHTGMVDKDSAFAALRTAEQLMRHDTFPKEQLDTWVAEIDTNPGAWMNRADDAIVIGITCARLGRVTEATRILAPLEADHAKASEALARQAWRNSDWRQAALHYERLNQASKERFDALYLSGLARSRAGEPEMGERSMSRALELVYHPWNQFRLALELRSLGETEQATEIVQRVVRSLPHHEPRQVEAIEFLQANAAGPKAIQRWSRQWMLTQARYIYGNGDQTDYLRVSQTLNDVQKSLNTDGITEP